MHKSAGEHVGTISARAPRTTNRSVRIRAPTQLSQLKLDARQPETLTQCAESPSLVAICDSRIGLQEKPCCRPHPTGMPPSILTRNRLHHALDKRDAKGEDEMSRMAAPHQGHEQRHRSTIPNKTSTSRSSLSIHYLIWLSNVVI